MKKIYYRMLILSADDTIQISKHIGSEIHNESLKNSARLVIEELLMNVISYGLVKSNKSVSVMIKLYESKSFIRISLVDDSEHFNQTSVKNNANAITTGGYGINLIKNLASSWSYKFHMGYNINVLYFKKI